MSNNLNLTSLTNSQTGKETAINALFGLLDAALTDSLAVDLSGGDGTVTADQWRQHAALIVSGATTGGRDITVPAVPGWMIICNDAGNTDDFTVTCGSTSVTFAAGVSGMVYADGTTDGLFSVAGGS